VGRGGGGKGKKTENYCSKKYRKIALFSLFQGGGGQRKKTQKIAIKAEKYLYEASIYYIVFKNSFIRIRGSLLLKI